MKCATCGYTMGPFDNACPRCANGVVTLAAVDCLVCQHSNSTKLYACTVCHARLPTDIATLTKLPLKEYQKKAATLGNEGRALKSLMVLKEAAEFYPEDIPTRQVLIGVLERTGRHSEILQYQNEVMAIEMKGSEAECLRHGDAAYLTGNTRRALGIFNRAVQYHPYSAVLHDRLGHAYQAVGEVDKAQFEFQIVTRLVDAQNQQELQRGQQRQQRSDNQANSAETAGAVAGAAIGTTGAVIGGGITILSLILGIGLILFGVAVSFFGVLLCITIIGILPGLLMLGVGVAIISAGAAAMAGGAAVGATGGMLGIFAGALTSGTALLHRSSRKKRN